MLVIITVLQIIFSWYDVRHALTNLIVNEYRTSLSTEGDHYGFLSTNTKHQRFSYRFTTQAMDGIAPCQFPGEAKRFFKPGHVDNRHTSIPAISDFTLTKSADVASSKLLEASLGGKVYDKVVLHVCNNDNKPYVEYTLYKAIISSYEMEALDVEDASHSRLQETFHINATKIEMRYLPHAGTPISAGYDVETASLV